MIMGDVRLRNIARNADEEGGKDCSQRILRGSINRAALVMKKWQAKQKQNSQCVSQPSKSSRLSETISQDRISEFFKQLKLQTIQPAKLFLVV